jgi:D-alanyl-D-alanine carboxypeptidase
MSPIAVLALLLMLRGAAPEPPRSLDPLLAPILARSGLPALGAALVTSSGLEAIGAVGKRSASASTPVTTGDRWHVGSCTKAMTATLAARLVERDLVRWEATVAEVLGPSMPRMSPGWRGVTLEQLLSHRSGAAKTFDEAIWERTARGGGKPRRQRRILVEDMLGRAPSTPPNTATIYSNAGYIIAGAMLEQLADASWEDLVRREVFAPLGMTSTGFGAPGRAGVLDQPRGHTRGASGWSPVEVGPGADNPVATGPAGSVHTTLADWSRFVAAHLRGARGDESFLTGESWKRLHTAGGAGGEYSPGWVVSRKEWADGVVLTHLGSNGFWLAEASMAMEKDFGILIVTNVSDDSAEAPFKETLAALVADRAAHAHP